MFSSLLFLLLLWFPVFERFSRGLLSVAGHSPPPKTRVMTAGGRPPAACQDNTPARAFVEPVHLFISVPPHRRRRPLLLLTSCARSTSRYQLSHTGTQAGRIPGYESPPKK